MRLIEILIVTLCPKTKLSEEKWPLYKKNLTQICLLLLSLPKNKLHACQACIALIIAAIS